MKYNETDAYQHVSVKGQPGVLTQEKISDKDLPEGFYRYALQLDDAGEYASLCQDAGDRSGGTYITKSPVVLNPNGELPLDEGDITYEDQEFEFEPYFGKHLAFETQVQSAVDRHEQQLMERSGKGRSAGRENEDSDREF